MWATGLGSGTGKDLGYLQLLQVLLPALHLLNIGLGPEGVPQSLCTHLLGSDLGFQGATSLLTLSQARLGFPGTPRAGDRDSGSLTPLSCLPGRPSETHRASTSVLRSASARTPTAGTVSDSCSSTVAQHNLGRRVRRAQRVSAGRGRGQGPSQGPSHPPNPRPTRPNGVGWGGVGGALLPV